MKTVFFLDVQGTRAGSGAITFPDVAARIVNSRWQGSAGVATVGVRYGNHGGGCEGVITARESEATAGKVKRLREALDKP